MHVLNFSIKTLSPVVISADSNSVLMTESHDEISGSIIRGVLATRYIKEKNLGDRAFADKDFLELFYGNIKFLSATPAISNNRSFILPQSLQRGKKGTDGEKKILDLMTTEKTPAGYKNLRGYGIVDDDKIFTASVSKNIFMHMSRSEDSERISGKSKEGHIYNYEALESGQIFFGQILGSESALKKLQQENETLIEFVGRSRFTQYGKCEFTFGKIEEIKMPNLGEKIYLRLESPLVPAEDNFICAENVLNAEIIKKLGENFKLGRIFASATEIENFVGVWGMKRPRVMALAAGTVFELETKNLTDADKKNLCEKIYSGFGVRTEEGFGQLRIWEPKDFTLSKLNQKITKPKNFSASTLEIARNILLEKILEQLRITAHEDANNLESQVKDGNFTHFFSRLNNLLSTVGNKNVRQKFAEKVSAESKNGTLFKDNLNKIKTADGQKLSDVLIGKAKLSYEGKKILAGDTEKLFGEIEFNEKEYSDKFCLEYLQNYFRAARKIAALKGGDNND